VSLLSHAACASMSTTTTTRDRGDRYGPIEWAQKGRQTEARNCDSYRLNGRFYDAEEDKDDDDMRPHRATRHAVLSR